MLEPQVKQRFSLHFYITSLFTVLILLCGLFIGWYSYNQLSKTMLDSGKLIFAQTTQQLTNIIKSETSHINTLLEALAVSQLPEADLQQRLKFVPMLKEMLEDRKSTKSLFISYPNNDLFLLRKIHAKEYVTQYNAPPQSRYMSTSVTNGKAVHNFYDQDLQLTLKTAEPDFQFNTEKRPWYKAAKRNSASTITDPYRFHSSREIGLTMALFNEQHDVIIGADYSLNDLSNSLALFKSSENTQIMIVNESGQVIAYNETEELLSESGKFVEQKTISEIRHPVLQYVFDNYQHQHGSTEFTYDGRQWLGKVSNMKTNTHLYLLQLVPIDELLDEAYELRNETVFITLLIILVTLPAAWYFSKKLTRPIRQLTSELQFIKDFDFSRPIKTNSLIQEIDELVNVTRDMKNTIGHFQDLSATLVGKQNFEELLKKVTFETISLSHAKGAAVLLADKSKNLNVAFAAFIELDEQQNDKLAVELKSLTFTAEQISQLNINQKNNTSNSALPEQFSPFLKTLITDHDKLSWRLLPLSNRTGESLGVLAIINDTKQTNFQGRQNFTQVMAGFSALAIEGQLLLAEQKELLQSFIHLIAGAIDSQSPYTGGHCERVPELTKMLSQAACAEKEGNFKDFALSDEQWEELHIASWLHDCGKIVTPEYVIDKATKLETIYDRIHEIRMRFELLKEQTEKEYWKGLAQGLNKKELTEQREMLLTTLDQEFTFVAECNIGGEFMSDDKIQRLSSIAQRTWTRTLDNKLGIAKQEKMRHKETELSLPQKEYLLADKMEHLIKREHLIEQEHAQLTAPGNPWGFNMKTPEYQFNRGELYNLSVKRGTLTPEDRFIINEHMVHTIVMLSKLPFPKHLENVPLIAGGHHEKMDGKGYPRAVPAGELPVTARIMVIADIFEALTASDRPYKERKTLSQSIKIMSFMAKDNHIDAQVFELFLSSGVYLQYAQSYLSEDQIDDVNISEYLS
ncbi:HD domain-containing phosphohydrolase [Psychromonas aquimarina]|uniref:HD domain-containing phosphohydrolase n=1 Tax=Psychromonas aquimarina TaxID=444919 RepID=UPI0004205C51|nr:HD domain-containing phosphohydrolase [Psychromonas aquimarina]